MFLPRRFQVLISALAICIEVWPLTTPYCSVPSSISKAHEVECRTVEGAPVVPDGYIVDIVPVEADLQIMIVLEQPLEPLKEHITLFFCHIVDELGMLTYWIEGLPSSNRIGAHHRTGFQKVSHLTSFLSMKMHEHTY